MIITNSNNNKYLLMYNLQTDNNHENILYIPWVEEKTSFFSHNYI